jgi:membrane fusion protein (multidrug efflux system)
VEAWLSPIEVRVRAVGTTRPVDSVVVTSEVSARVESLGFSDEEVVEAGRVLARLDASLASADLNAAKARMERLRLQHERTLDAFRAGASNQSEVDNARTQLAEAQADVERAERIVEDHVIRAAFAGRVGRRLVSVGALVEPSDAITELRSVDPMELVFSAPEVYLAAMRIGARVQATSPAFPERVFEGTLKVTGSTVDAATRTVEVYAKVPNTDGALRPGMFMSIELVVGEKQDAVLIPESAVVREGARSDVFLIRDGRAHRTRVELGERSPGVVEVLKGVTAGDRVVTQGLQRVRDGVKVDATPDDELDALGVKVGAAMSAQPGWGGAFAERYNASGAQSDVRERLNGLESPVETVAPASVDAQERGEMSVGPGGMGR